MSPMKNGRWPCPTLPCCPRPPGSVPTCCARRSTACATWCATASRGGRCPTTCRRGTPCTTRRCGGCGRAASRCWRTTCGRCCAWRRGAGRSLPPPSWTAGPCAARPRAARAGWDGHKRTRGSKLHLAVDTLGHLLALHVTAASENDRAAVAELAEAVQDATGENVTLAYVDQGYTGERPAEAARAHGIVLEVVAPPAAKRGFVLLPRRWVVERSFAWMARCRRLARDHERLPETLAGFHFVAFTDLMLRRAGDLALVHNTL